MRRHNTATLMGMNKRELVEYVRMAEHNQDVAEETLKQQAENVKDWIPVVRCKDCKHRYIASSGVIFCTQFLTMSANDNDFCSYGERKDNA